MAQESRPQIEIVAHRGARARWPENTLPGFEYVLAEGLTTIECDLCVTRDLQLVVAHDPQISRVLARGPDGATIPKPSPYLFHLDLAEVRKFDVGSVRAPGFPDQQAVPGTPIPTLDELMTLLRTSAHPAAKSVKLSLEMKTEPKAPGATPAPAVFAKLLIEALDRHGMRERVRIISFDFDCLREVNRLDPRIPLTALVEDSTVALLDAARNLPVDAVGPKWELLTPYLVGQIRLLGVELIVWTANEPEAWQRLLALDVEGITTDDPVALRKYLAEQGRPVGSRFRYPSRHSQEQEWKAKLTPEQYRVMRLKGTERPFSGEYERCDDPGTYRCGGCGEPLFSSEAKFDAGCGWPSFTETVDPARVEELTDTTHGMLRTEVTCRNCGAHLGHVFPDGPAPTRQRYCINSVSLKLERGAPPPPRHGKPQK